MRSLFTIHAGEYLVGREIERRFPALDVWIPARDRGIDLLITGGAPRKSVAVQVKFSRLYAAANLPQEIRNRIHGYGWWRPRHSQLADAMADSWVFVLHDVITARTHYVVIPPRELLGRLEETYGTQEAYHFYLAITTNGGCLDVRALSAAERQHLALHGTLEGPRNYSGYLEGWSCMAQLGE